MVTPSCRTGPDDSRARRAAGRRRSEADFLELAAQAASRLAWLDAAGRRPDDARPSRTEPAAGSGRLSRMMAWAVAAAQADTCRQRCAAGVSAASGRDLALSGTADRPSPSRRRPRPGLAVRSARASTPWSSRRPGRARRWPRSCGPSTSWPASRPRPMPKRRCRVLYISPLKALAVDVERNLRSPLTGVRHAARRLGLPEPDIRVARPDRRHRRRRAPQAGHQAAGHPDHHAGVAVPDADLAGQGDACAASRPSSSTRCTRWPAASAARTWRCRWSGSTRCGRLTTRLARRPGAADRPVGDRPAAGGGRGVPRRRAAGHDRGAAQREAARPQDRRPGRGHGRPAGRRSEPAPAGSPQGRERAAGSAAAATRRGSTRSGRTSRSGCST